VSYARAKMELSYILAEYRALRVGSEGRFYFYAVIGTRNAAQATMFGNANN